MFANTVRTRRRCWHSDIRRVTLPSLGAAIDRGIRPESRLSAKRSISVIQPPLTASPKRTLQLLSLWVLDAPSADLRPKTLEWPLGGQQRLSRWNGCSDHHNVLGNEPLPKRHEQKRPTVIGGWFNSKALNSRLKAVVGLLGRMTGGAVTSLLGWLPSVQQTSCAGAVKLRS